MTPAEASDLLSRCAAFDNRKPSLVAAQAWANALHDVPLDQDTFAAVDQFYATPPAKPGERLWIQPHDVRAHRRQIRADRTANFVYEPPAGDEDPAFLTRFRAQLAAVASGIVAAPSTAPALEGGPHPDVVRALEGVGREVLDDDEDQAAVAAVRRPGPLGRECPKCSASIGRPCRTPGGKERVPHPARRGEAGDPQCRNQQQRSAA